MAAVDQSSTRLSQDEKRLRAWGWLVAVPLTPIVIIATALTVSIFGTIFGLPVLLLTARPWWAGLSVGMSRTKPEEWTTPMRVNLALCLAAAALTFVFCFASGFNDLYGWTNLIGTLVIAAMLLTCLYGGTRLLTRRSAGCT